MTIAVCLDDNRGMIFNHRRQSRDRVLIDDFLRDCAHRRVLISPFSASLFPADGSVGISDDFLSEAKEDDCCFVENADISGVLDKIEKVIVYRWNRLYPADTFFTVDLNAAGFRLASSVDFPGFSHDKITKEVYVK